MQLTSHPPFRIYTETTSTKHRKLSYFLIQ